MLNVLNKLDEITQAGVARKQRSITRLFPEFPARVKTIGAKGGIRLRQMQPDYWHFKLHSGTKDNVWYDGYIRFKDLVEFLSTAVKDKRLWTRDKQHVDLRKLAKKVMFDCQMQLKCSCPAFQYWGPAYIMSLRKYDGMFGDRETRPPRIRNPRQYGAVCKHAQAMLNAYPFYLSTLAGFLRDTHTGQIRYLENEAKKEGQGFKKAAGELKRRKKAKEAKPKEIVPSVEEPAVEEEEPRESIVVESMADRLGQCYVLAGRYIMDNHDTTLVHGTINGFRFTGKDHDNNHAWIEDGNEVYDLVWDKRFPTEVYYGMMQAKVFKKYDWEAAALAMLQAEHWGPWHDVNEAFVDIFQPLDKEAYWNRFGGIKNDDGTWTFGKYTLDFKAKPNYPILSHRYEENVYVMGKLEGMPRRARAFQKVITTLEGQGVDWIEFNRLRQLPPRNMGVNTGIQAVGKYDDMMVILETKVGVRDHSAGYQSWVGYAEDVQSVEKGVTHISTEALLKWTLKRMRKFRDEKARARE